MHTHTTPFLGQQSAPTANHPPIRLPQAALPHWTRPLIRPIDDGRSRAYAVVSSSRADLPPHEVDMIAQTCSCEDWDYSHRENYPLDHPMRACTHLLDCQDYEREQAGIALTAVAEIARCVVCGAPAVPGGIHCRVTSWGRGYCATRASRALDDVFGIEEAL